ncbi:alpha/beta hydrolase [Candidatus Saccharibacteria bacterium CPR2]|nr:alpha/beta hydrolase [Candidatus Saccharibacteria bacterium CPR2]
MNLIVNNLKIHVQDVGKRSKPCVLFLHGWGASGNSFSKLIEEIGDNYRCVAPDLPGFGASEIPTKAWGVKEYANFVHDLTAKLGIKKIHAICSHSMGGRIAMHITAQRILRPGKLILIGSHGIVQAKSLRNRAYKVVAKVGKKATLVLPNRVRSQLRDKLYRQAGASDYLTAGAMRDTFINLINTDSQPDAALIDIPSLLIYGKNDKQTPPSFGKIFHELMPNSKLNIVSGADHFIHETEPKIVATQLKEFL